MRNSLSKRGCLCWGVIGWLVLAWAVLPACSSSTPAPGVSPTPTQAPTPIQVATSTPAAVPQEESGFTGPDPGALPEAVGPQGLGRVSLPDNADSIAELFNGLPSKLIGSQRTIQLKAAASGEITASYGTTQPVGCATVGLNTRNVSTGDFFPLGWTAERVIAVFTIGADWNVEDFGREGELFWVTWNTTCSSAGSSLADSIFIISWGVAGSPWVFSASAGDSKGRDELAAAFVTASK